MRSGYMVGVVAIGVFVLALLVVPALWMAPDKYTALATAVQAFGTVMAFVAAAAAFIWQWTQGRQAGFQRAARLWSEVNPFMYKLGDPSMVVHDDVVQAWHVLIRNNTPEPFFRHSRRCRRWRPCPLWS